MNWSWKDSLKYDINDIGIVNQEEKVRLTQVPGFLISMKNLPRVANEKEGAKTNGWCTTWDDGGVNESLRGCVSFEASWVWHVPGNFGLPATPIPTFNVTCNAVPLYSSLWEWRKFLWFYVHGTGKHYPAVVSNTITWETPQQWKPN